MTENIKVWKNGRRNAWRQMPMAKRLAVVLLLLSSDWTLFASGEYHRLHGLAGGLIAGFWVIVNIAVVTAVVDIVRRRRRAS